MANQSKIPDKIKSHDMFDHFLKPVIKKLIPTVEKMANIAKGRLESSFGKNTKCCLIRKSVELNWPK